MSRVLIVDDDPVLTRIYRSKFTSEGFAAVCVADGESALASIAQERPAALVLDLMLPGLSGLEVLRRVRARPECRDLPIVVFSNAYLDEDIAAARQAGADRVLAKASNGPRQVVDAVRATIAKRAAAAPPPAPARPPQVALPILAALPSPPSLLPVQPVLPEPAALPEVAPLVGRAGRITTTRTYHFQANSGTFTRQCAATLAEVGRVLTTLAHTSTQLVELARQFHQLASRAAAAEHIAIARLAEAAGSLAHQLLEAPRKLSTSTRRTLVQAHERLVALNGSTAPAPELGGCTALVVDDEAISRTTMGLALAKVGVAVIAVDHPQAALAAAAGQRFPLVLTDVMMQGMSGFQLVTRLRALHGYARTPMILVTGAAEFDQTFRATPKGADDLIAKPFLLMELGTKALIHLLDDRVEAWAGA
jgi:CheY-like chemotaxis protein